MQVSSVCEDSAGQLHLTTVRGGSYIGRHEIGGSRVELWREKLAAGNSEGAWDEFITRYRRLILATIRRSLGDDDDVADVFAEVCANLSADDLGRLKRHNERTGARFSTW